MPVLTKVCTTCGEDKPLSEYHKQYSRLRSNCKPCRRAEENARYHLTKPPLLPKKPYRSQRERWQAWADKNREHVNATGRERSKRYRPRLAAHCRNRYARKKQALGAHTLRHVEQIFAKQEGQCAVCKIGLSAGYHVDHVFPLTKLGGNGPCNLQVLCRSCNSRKSNKLPWEFNMQHWLEMAKG